MSAPPVRAANRRASGSGNANGNGLGLGCWLHEKTGLVWLEGDDAEVSVRSVHEPDSGLTHDMSDVTDDGA